MNQYIGRPVGKSQGHTHDDKVIPPRVESRPWTEGRSMILFRGVFHSSLDLSQRIVPHKMHICYHRQTVVKRDSH